MLGIVPAGSSAILTLSKTTSGGFTTTYGYTASSYGPQLTSVTGADGRIIQISWRNQYVNGIVLPDGTSLRYTYSQPNDGAPTSQFTFPDLLTKVERIAADGAVAWSQSYLYEDPVEIYALTGIVDALGNRQLIDKYNAAGQVIQNGLADGSETLTIAYDFYKAGAVSFNRTVTNALGKVTHYSFNTDPISNTDALTGIAFAGVSEDASTLSPARGNNYGSVAGDVTSAADYRGIKTAFAYDALHRPAAITLAVGTAVQRVEGTTWHPTLDRPLQTVVPGLTTTFTYDDIGRVLTRTEIDTTTQTVPYATAGQQRVWTYTYTGLGKLATLQGPKSPDAGGHPDLTSYTYDTNNNLLTATNGLGQVTTFANYDANGRPKRMTAAGGMITDFTYDAIGRLLTRTVRHPTDPAQDAVTTLGYDLEGRLLSVAPPATAPLAFAYSAVGRLLTITDGSGAHIDYSYDLLGDRIQDKTSSSTGMVASTVTRTFDDLGRMLSETLGPGRVHRVAYDLGDNPVTQTNARNKATVAAFDPLDRLASVVDPLKGKTATAYDGQDNPVRHTDKIAVATTFVRNGFGEVIQESSPDRGTSISYYDAAGDVVTAIDGRGQQIAYTRDILGRVTTKLAAGIVGQDVAYLYDTAFVGQLATMTDASGTTGYTYDPRGNIATKQVTISGGFTATTAYVYDRADRIVAATFPSGKIVTYTRDTLGRVTAIGLQASAGAPVTKLASGMTYNPFGPLTKATLGNGLVLAQGWGSDVRLYSKSLTRPAVGKVPAAALWSKRYGYDGDDNITKITDVVTPAKTAAYTYDALSRLTRATGNFGAFAREDYTYDANDNRLRLDQRTIATDVTPGATATLTLSPGTNRLASVSAGLNSRTLSYDGRGNLAGEVRSAGIITTGYDAYARLTSYANVGVPVFAMAYDGLDQRVQVTAGGQVRNFVYDESGRLIGEYGATVATSPAEHIWLDPDNDGPQAYQPLALAGASTLWWVTGDHLGTPVLLTDASGAVANAYDTTPFGQRWFAKAASPTTAQGFPGQLIDIADRYYNMHRDYDPTTGRYLQADPIGLAGGDNRYAYVGGNPMGRVDPNGQIAFLVIPGICALGGCEALGLGIAASTAWMMNHPIKLPPKASLSRTKLGCPPNDRGSDSCVEGWIDEVDNYCVKTFKGQAYGRCVSRANDRLHACKSAGGHWPPNGPDRWSYQDEHRFRP